MTAKTTPLTARLAAPFADRRHELFNRLFFRPEVSVQQGNVGDRPRALLGHELFDGRVPRNGMGESIPLLAIHLDHLVIQIIPTRLEPMSDNPAPYR
jgi:hypothetical protein